MLWQIFTAGLSMFSLSVVDINFQRHSQKIYILEYNYFSLKLFGLPTKNDWGEVHGFLVRELQAPFYTPVTTEIKVARNTQIKARFERKRS